MTPDVRRIWIASQGSRKPWKELSLARKRKLTREFEEWFNQNEDKLLEKTPRHVKTANQFFGWFAEQFQRNDIKRITEQLIRSQPKSEQYETLLKKRDRLINSLSIYEGVCRALRPKKTQ